MKYIAIMAAIIFLVRIDFFLGEIEKLSSRFTPAPPEVEASAAQASSPLIPVSQDASLKQSPRDAYLSLLSSFRVNPDRAIREKAMEIFKSHPTMFSSRLDEELEAQIFRWQDHLNNNEPELVLFLYDLTKILQGENQAMLTRFFSLWIDIDMENFLAAYSKSRDSNCTIITTFGNNVPEEEKLNEYYDREDALKSFVAKENVEPTQRSLANNCLLVLGLKISQMTPPVTPATNSEEQGGNAP